MGSALRILAGLAGLLVGAEGTSLPELAIGIDAARQGSPALALGNIVGANLVSILFILGLSALLRPITFARLTCPVPELWRRISASCAIAGPGPSRRLPRRHPDRAGRAG
jgi:Ca2+/Na+ antiporter